MKKSWLMLAGACLLVITVLIFVFGDKVSAPNGQYYTKTKIASHDVLLEIADSPASRQQGLSGRAGLADNHGMLFVFENSEQACFWMKDMKFSIDILWFDENKQLIHQELDVSPVSYPNKFCSNSLARYVVELKAGTSKKLNLSLGDEVKF